MALKTPDSWRDWLAWLVVHTEVYILHVLYILEENGGDESCSYSNRAWCHHYHTGHRKHNWQQCSDADITPQKHPLRGLFSASSRLHPSCFVFIARALSTRLVTSHLQWLGLESIQELTCYSDRQSGRACVWQSSHTCLYAGRKKQSCKVFCHYRHGCPLILIGGQLY